MVKIIKVISGGQTGSDQAGLFVAKALHISTGGWAPKDYMTSEGPNPTLLRDTYGLEECQEPGYPPRTYLNAKNSDCTIRLAYKFDTAGEICTLKAIRYYRRQFQDINLMHCPEEHLDHISQWFNLLGKDYITVNIAGNRQSENFDVFGESCKILFKLFKKVNDYGE